MELNPAEREPLKALLNGGKTAVRKIKRAQSLLAADAGPRDEEIAALVGVGASTVYRTKRRFVLGNVEAALNEAPRPGAERKLCGKERGPAGRHRLHQAALRACALDGWRCGPERSSNSPFHASLSRETVRRRLAENELKPWRQKMWCIPQVDGTYVARREDVLDLYAEAPDPRHPVVCFDESPTQLIGEVRPPVPAAPGQLQRYDYEYRRHGTANLFIFLDPHRPWRQVKVTGQRTARDFAECMRDRVDLHYPQADRIRVVLDNLSTHTPGALYETFPAPEAHRLLRRLEFHYTPKHASWLNRVEIEIGVWRSQCLDRRIGERDRLITEIAAWERQRNATGARINWMFTTDHARAKLVRAYPQPAKES